MKTDLFMLILPAFFILLTVIVKFKTSLPKAFYISFLCISIYLALGIYIPAMVWLVDKRTHLRQITFTDEQGKPISGVGVTLASSYVIGNVDISYDEYRREAYLSDENGIVTIPNHIKPLPILLIPFLMRFYDGTGYFAYKSGYYPVSTSSKYSQSTISITIEKVIDNRKLYKLLDEYHYYHYKNIRNFVNYKSAECYSKMYNYLMTDAQQLHVYDKENVIANSYKSEYQRIVNDMKFGGINAID